MFNHEPNVYDCPLCVVAKGGETKLNKKSDIIFEDNTIVAFISPKWWKNNPGNVIVIPRQHIENVYEIQDALLAQLYVVGKQIALGMKETYGCHGVSFRQHNEPDGGQDVWHFHLHVFPRWKDDDLYLNHKNTRYTEADERQPYSQKLKGWFSARDALTR
jgi:histidine triad (HIT) family protein